MADSVLWMSMQDKARSWWASLADSQVSCS